MDHPRGANAVSIADQRLEGFLPRGALRRFVSLEKLHVTGVECEVVEACADEEPVVESPEQLGRVRSQLDDLTRKVREVVGLKR